MSAAVSASRSDAPSFLLVHALLVPGAFALAAVASTRFGIDRAVTDLFFDPDRGTFPARDWLALELLGHRGAKSAAVALWLALAAAALASLRVAQLARYRRVLWATVTAMAAGPLIVMWLKGINAHPCPWNLKEYGGYADYADAWFVSAAEAGRCFPSGHAAGGFSLVALAFAARALHRDRLAQLALAVALAGGALASAVRIVQGAHFLAHNLWSAAVVWCTAALVFAPLMRAHGDPR
jgi:membrane-associated PAP2 superfamily phosphatase